MLNDPSTRLIGAMLLLACCLALTACTAPDPISPDPISIENPRIRWLPGDGPMAGYFTVSNHGNDSVMLTGVSTAAFDRVMMHQTIEQAGQVRMQPQASITLPAGRTVDFIPGGLHLMLMGPRESLQPGDEISMTLEFEKQPAQSVRFSVRKPGEV